MNRKITALFALVIFSLSFRFASADLKINEFVSDPESGSEWFELWNDSSSELDLSGWSWTELTSPGTENEKEGSQKNLSGTVLPDGFFVIEMNSALNNAGDSIGLYDSGSLADRVTYGKVNGYAKDLGVPAKGKSGALISGDWSAGVEPTKGSANSEPVSSDDSGGADVSGSSSSSSGDAEDVVITVIQKLKAELSVRNLAYVGIPHSFSGKVMQGSTQIYNGRYFWNFGDGNFRETKVVNTDKFAHTYFYPGDYTVLFEYYPDSFAEVPEVSQKISIKVIEPTVVISRVGGAGDFFVELLNNANYEVDLSGWLLVSDLREFKLPKNTSIGANKKMIISGRTSGLTLADLPSLKLMKPDRGVVFQYFASFPHQISTTSILRKDVSSNTGAENSNLDLAAASLLYNTSATEIDAVGDESSSIIYFALLAGLLGGALYTVHKIRRSGTTTELGEDFEITDEGYK